MTKKSSVHRREFLSSSMKGVAAGALITSLQTDAHPAEMPRIFSGRTTPAATNWQPYPGGGGVFVDVETNLPVKGNPIYIVSLGGRTNHWGVTGDDCVYPINPKTNVPDARGFRIHVRWESAMAKDQDPLTPELANSYAWHINWIAIVGG